MVENRIHASNQRASFIGIRHEEERPFDQDFPLNWLASGHQHVILLQHVSSHNLKYAVMKCGLRKDLPSHHPLLTSTTVSGTLNVKKNVCKDYVADLKYPESGQGRPSKNIQSLWAWPRSNKHDILV